jgi:hypothetical protein
MLPTPYTPCDATYSLDTQLDAMLDQAITSRDPAVIAELLARESDFPKLWGREVSERGLSQVAGDLESAVMY